MVELESLKVERYRYSKIRSSHLKPAALHLFDFRHSWPVERNNNWKTKQVVHSVERRPLKVSVQLGAYCGYHTWNAIRKELKQGLEEGGGG